MEISFGDKALRHICENELAAQQAFGEKASEKLRHRIADIRSAESISDLMAGNPRRLQGRHHDEVAVTVYQDVVMVFCMNHNVPPLLESGDIDWTRVSRIKILRIGQEDD